MNDTGVVESRSGRGVATATMAAKGGSAKSATHTPYKKMTVGSTTKAAAPRYDLTSRIINSDTEDGDDSDSHDDQYDVMSDQEEDIGRSSVPVAKTSNGTKKRKSESETSTTAQSEKALKSKSNMFEKMSSGNFEKPAYASRSKIQLPPHNPSDHSDYYVKGRKV